MRLITILMVALFCVSLAADSGSAGESSSLLATQQALKILGYDPGPVDGVMGPKTRAALRRYRVDSGLGPPRLYGDAGEYLGNLSANRYDLNSTSNPYGTYGSEYSPQSINNPYGQYGSPYSSSGATNPYTNGGPRIFGSDGRYLGRLNSNRFDPESVSNPYGVYGSPYSAYSINNPYGTYGSPYSSRSATNPSLIDLNFDD